MEVVFHKNNQVGIFDGTHRCLIFEKQGSKVVHVTTQSSLERLVNGTRDLWVPKAEFKRAVALAYRVLFARPKKQPKSQDEQLTLF